MALAGINKKVLASLAGKPTAIWRMRMAAMAKERKTTRAAISMELASKSKTSDLRCWKCAYSVDTDL